VTRIRNAGDLDRFCGFAERFLTDEQSRPLVIEPWQRKLLSDYFDGTRELVVIVSKKNGKTSLFAALALWHLISAAFADVGSVLHGPPALLDHAALPPPSAAPR
jgi:hypothetical protein